MSERQLDDVSRRDVPAAAGDDLERANGKTMSENTVSRGDFEKVLRQAQRRKSEIEQLTKQLQETQAKLVTLQTERDEAVQVANETLEAYQTFTDENEMLRELEGLRADIRVRDFTDMFNSVEGIEYQPGVTLHDVLTAAGVDLSEIDEIPEDFTAQVIEAARASKPYLFAGSVSAQEPAQNQGDVRQQATPAPSRPEFRAFGAQAAGGGSAPPSAKPDPAKSVDWTDPRAINAFVRNRDEASA